MKKFVQSFVALALILTFAACSGGPKGKVLVEVGGEKITEGDLEMLATINPRLKAQLASEFGKKKILDNLIEQELFYQASVKEGLNRSPGVKDKIELYTRVIISQAYMEKAMEEAARKYYDEHKNEFEKLQLSYIFIKFQDSKDNKKERSEKEALDLANKIKQRIEAGEDFATVAKEVSEDTMTNKRGGDLGLVSKDEARLTRRGLGPVLEKAYTMKVGEIGGPIKTENGYCLVIVTKGAELQPLDVATQGILFKIRATAKDEIVADLKKRFKVEYLTSKKKPEEKNAEAKKEEAKDEVEDKKEESAPEAKEPAGNPAEESATQPAAGENK